ncbi:phytoene/squalene synthase family protein [Paenibacillus sp. LMG 31456]|uniref:Phytoene/squalene synthase family protein n=1 Tax=Paenibacillus foliorum TaxID=2654974 RepID=A0A972GQ13_9BACL|nr:squalene/phytoene synthase family protein [Paenibacillus foliorum]NOU94288.1 phytoene/squalene synthase family protein [Paenibacillus foliorum]
MDMLAETSRTFLIPISRLVPGIKEAVASAYLCMRAIDEIEDHTDLPPEVKAKLLLGVSKLIQVPSREAELRTLFQPYQDTLCEVTVRLNDWVNLCPTSIAPRVIQSTAIMAEQMAEWVEREWKINTEEDLDYYTYCVAGAVGELLSDLWKWFDGTETDRVKAVAFGRGLQAVNIVRNRIEDSTRGVDFFPPHWGIEDMFAYTTRNLEMANEYIADIKPGPILDFCSIPLALAHGTLFALSNGESKLNREAVLQIVSRITGED